MQLYPPSGRYGRSPRISTQVVSCGGSVFLQLEGVGPLVKLVCLVLQFARAKPSGQKPCRYRVGFCRTPASLRLGYSVAAVQSALHLLKRSVSSGAVLKSLSYVFSATPAFELLGVPDSRLSSTGIQHLRQVCLSDRVTILRSWESVFWSRVRFV